MSIGNRKKNDYVCNFFSLFISRSSCKTRNFPPGISGGRTPEVVQPRSPTKPARTYQFDYQPPVPPSTATPFDQVKLSSSALPLKTEEFRRSRGALDIHDEQRASATHQPTTPAAVGGGVVASTGYQHHASYLDSSRIPPREINGCVTSGVIPLHLAEHHHRFRFHLFIIRFKLKTVEREKDQPQQQPKELVSILKKYLQLETFFLLFSSTFFR